MGERRDLERRVERGWTGGGPGLSLIETGTDGFVESVVW